VTPLRERKNKRKKKGKRKKREKRKIGDLHVHYRVEWSGVLKLREIQ
jgi:hypothetical protein